LHYHIERLGLWTALTFLGTSPDLLIEEDLDPRALADYKLLIVVGDHLPPKKAAVVQRWVEQGGTVLATAGAGLNDPYGEPNQAWPALLGLTERETIHHDTFLRPRQELPFIKPRGAIVGDGWYWLRLATTETIEPAETAEVTARLASDDSPMGVRRDVGRGAVVYVAGLPGVAYLWAALQPPAVPDRGISNHQVPVGYDPGVRRMLAAVLKRADVQPRIIASPPLIDARLVRSGKGFYLPVSNYHRDVDQPVSLTIRLDRPIKHVTSAYHGKLPHAQQDGAIHVTIPALGYGDMLRLAP
jgi:hypothetical protein